MAYPYPYFCLCFFGGPRFRLLVYGVGLRFTVSGSGSVFSNSVDCFFWVPNIL